MTKMHAFIAVFLMMLFMAFDSASAQMSCGKVFTGTQDLVPVHEARATEWRGAEIPYTQVSEKEFYNIEKDLPQLKDAFLISVDRNGHVSLSYKNIRIDSDGFPMVAVKGKKRNSHALMPGVVFALHDLPAGFDQRFQEFISEYRSRTTITCVSNACGTLQQLGLTEIARKKFITASGFYDHLMDLSAQGRLEAVSLGQNMDGYAGNIRSFQTSFVVNQSVVLMLSIGFPIIAAVSRLSN